MLLVVIVVFFLLKVAMISQAVLRQLNSGFVACNLTLLNGIE